MSTDAPVSYRLGSIVDPSTPFRQNQHMDDPPSGAYAPLQGRSAFDNRIELDRELVVQLVDVSATCDGVPVIRKRSGNLIAHDGIGIRLGPYQM
jgi:hypothetical protein